MTDAEFMLDWVKREREFLGLDPPNKYQQQRYAIFDALEVLAGMPCTCFVGEVSRRKHECKRWKALRKFRRAMGG